jgi:hypothetical protein
MPHNSSFHTSYQRKGDQPSQNTFVTTSDHTTLQRMGVSPPREPQRSPQAPRTFQKTSRPALKTPEGLTTLLGMRSTPLNKYQWPSLIP